MSSLFNCTALTRSLAIATAALLPFSALADEVVLKSSDGTVNIVGEFVDFADDNYVIRTALGELRIGASRVRCEGEACPTIATDSADVVFAGSDTVGLGMMPLLMSGYAGYLEAEASVKATEAENEIIADFISDGGFGDPIGSYLVTSTTSGDAFRTLLDQSAQVGMSSRRIRPDEARELRDNGAGNMISTEQEHIIAVDSLVVIVNPENKVSSISLEQLAGIYAGEITNWSELGGSDASITVLDRQETSGTHGVFKNGIFGENAENAPRIGEVAETNSDMAALVNDDPNAIGYVGYAFQRGASPLSLVNECGIETTPDAFSAKTEEYPLQRRLFLYNRSDNASEKAVDFINFAKSSEADGVIAKSGFIDFGVKVQEMDMTGSRAQQLLDPEVDDYEGGVMREMLGQMINYDRLSTTFRFATGSSQMDERSAVDMARLVDYLQTQPAGSQLLFVGFTDSIGAFDSNRALSDRRAALAAEEFAAFAGDAIADFEVSASGYGEIAPAACNTTELGRSINRRVEVWIQPAP